MSAIVLQELVNENNFDEVAYLYANPDVAKSVKKGVFGSGKAHFERFGKSENRFQRHSVDIIRGRKIDKLSRIDSILDPDMERVYADGMIDFLTEELRSEFNIIDTDNISGHDYDTNVKNLIDRYESGIILDCGAGRRPVYYDNVVNFEIAAYDTTDVRGVGEVLPFVDNAFDAVISMAVLEHVKDPFLCAKEIARVLKPNGELLCSTPFLQPLHGYPHHYYNMTVTGLKNLFSDYLSIEKLEVYGSLLPIYSLHWILNSWSAGLTGEVKDRFHKMTVSDLMEDPSVHLSEDFVVQLTEEKNFELANGVMLHGHKR